MTSDSGGFLVPTEFLADLKLGLMYTILSKLDLDFTVPLLPKYIELKNIVGNLPKLWRGQFRDYESEAFKLPDFFHWRFHSLLGRFLNSMTAAIYGGLQAQWTKACLRQEKLRKRTIMTAWAERGFGDDMKEVLRQWAKLKEGKEDERDDGDA